MVFSPDCISLAIVSAVVSFWNITNGTCRQALKDETQEVGEVDELSVTEAVFLLNGKFVVIRADTRRAMGSG